MKKKVLGIRSKNRIQLLMDILSVFMCAGLILACLPALSDITSRGCIAICAIQLIQTIGLLVAFEEYSASGSKWEEKVVCIFLSCFFSFVFAKVENWIFLGSAKFAKAHLMIFIFSFFSLFLSNGVFHFVVCKHFYSRQRMLVIVSEKTDSFRLARLHKGGLADFELQCKILEQNNDIAIKTLLYEEIREYDAICIFDNLGDGVCEAIVKKAMLLNKEVYTIPSTIDINRSRANYVRFDDILACRVQKYELSNVELFVKRVFDLTAALVCLILAAIPMLIIALSIKFTSTGPIVYKQVRLTRNKREFYIYKFRTMIMDAEKESGPIFAKKNDPRITSVGKFLRCYRLDELPQLFNIIKGDMSFVGPRPERPFFVEQFEREIENYHYRFMVKAGLTSLSHVYGRYSTYIQDRTCYDLLYIANYSFLLDLKIILLTTKTLLLKDAAEGLEADETSLST